MTNITKLFEEAGERGIITLDFLLVLSTGVPSLTTGLFKACDWRNIKLISRGRNNENFSWDVIFCWNEKPSDGATYLGHWNAGVVEWSECKKGY
jgi:hypothetical protein